MQIFGKTATPIPAAVAEGTQTEARMDKYGAQDVIPRMDAQEANAMEGSCYVARATPAPGGSGIALGIQTTFSDTANPCVVLQNGGTTKTIVPQYIRGRCTAAGSSTTSAEIAIEVDSTNRYSSGGTALTGVPTNPIQPAATTGAVIHVGAVTAAAAGTGRAWIYSRLIRQAVAPCWIIGDEILFDFGALGTGAVPYTKFANPLDTQATPGTAFTFAVISCAIPPTGTMLVHMANVANATTAPSFEWEIGYIER